MKKFIFVFLSLLYIGCSSGPSNQQVEKDLIEFGKKNNRLFGSIQIVGGHQEKDYYIVDVTLHSTYPDGSISPINREWCGDCELKVMFNKFGDKWKFKTIDGLSSCK